ncbi:hypothetical protein ACE6H2_006586 [Prunus campanulata]
MHGGRQAWPAEWAHAGRENAGPSHVWGPRAEAGACERRALREVWARAGIGARKAGAYKLKTMGQGRVVGCTGPCARHGPRKLVSGADASWACAGVAAGLLLLAAWADSSSLNFFFYFFFAAAAAFFFVLFLFLYSNSQDFLFLL